MTLRRDRSGVAALEMALQLLQLAGDQTARCVGIGSAACASPSAYAVNAARNFGAVVDPTGIVADLIPAGPSACASPAGNSAARVQMTVTFTSPLLLLLPFLSHSFTTTSCCLLTGR